jgi:hypothetical protein
VLLFFCANTNQFILPHCQKNGPEGPPQVILDLQEVADVADTIINYACTDPPIPNQPKADAAKGSALPMRQEQTNLYIRVQSHTCYAEDDAFKPTTRKGWFLWEPNTGLYDVGIV